MISLCSKLPNYDNSQNALYVKINSLYKAYGAEYTFCQFWQQTEPNGNVTALICKFYSSITLCTSQGADKAEIIEFVNAIGYSEIISNLKLYPKAEALNSVVKVCNGNNAIIYDSGYKHLKECYDVLCSDNSEINIGEFFDWYVDVAHRIRHGAAFTVKKAQGAALCLLGSDALLNGIAINPHFRRKGYGKDILQSVLSITPTNKLYAICSDSLIDFYLNSGFKTHDKIYLYKGKY